jgi:hypothetical protein
LDLWLVAKGHVHDIALLIQTLQLVNFLPCEVIFLFLLQPELLDFMAELTNKFFILAGRFPESLIRLLVLFAFLFKLPFFALKILAESAERPIQLLLFFQESLQTSKRVLVFGKFRFKPLHPDFALAFHLA